MCKTSKTSRVDGRRDEEKVPKALVDSTVEVALGHPVCEVVARVLVPYCKRIERGQG